MRKGLEAYMDEQGGTPKPPEAERHNLSGHWSNLETWLSNMLWIVIM